MTINITQLLLGARAIETAKDEIRCLLSIVKPICFTRSFAGEKFKLPRTDREYSWELRDAHDGKSFFQLWEVIRRGHTDRFWEGFVDAVPPTEKVLVVRDAFPFFLDECAKKIPDFEEKQIGRAHV